MIFSIEACGGTGVKSHFVELMPDAIISLPSAKRTFYWDFGKQVKKLSLRRELARFTLVQTADQ